MSASEDEEELTFDDEVSSKYRSSESHSKTMEILGKTKNLIK